MTEQLKTDPLFIFAHEVIHGAYKPEELKDAAMRAIRHHSAQPAQAVPDGIVWKEVERGADYIKMEGRLPDHPTQTAQAVPVLSEAEIDGLTKAVWGSAAIAPLSAHEFALAIEQAVWAKRGVSVPYDQTALELCTVCGWKTLIPGDCCLNCERQTKAEQPEPQLKRTHPLDMPLEVFLEDLPTRPRKIIKDEMMYFTHSGDEYMKPPFTVRHLLMFSRSEMRKWPNLGKKSLNEIEECLRNRGLQLWEQHDERSLKFLRQHPTYWIERHHGIVGKEGA